MVTERQGLRERAAQTGGAAQQQVAVGLYKVLGGWEIVRGTAEGGREQLQANYK